MHERDDGHREHLAREQLPRLQARGATIVLFGYLVTMVALAGEGNDQLVEIAPGFAIFIALVGGALPSMLLAWRTRLEDEG